MNTNGTFRMLPEADFGPSATGRFDFTLGFEDAILSLLPSALFLVLAPPRLLWLMKQPYKVTKSRSTVLKLVCAGFFSSLCLLINCTTDTAQGLISLYAALQLTILLYWALGPTRVKLQTAAAALTFVNGVLLLFVSHAENTRPIHPSTLITVYLFLTLLFDCVIARTLWLLQDTGVAARLFTTTVATKALVLAAEVWEKRSILLSRYQGVSPEMTSSILSNGVFWWLNPLMKTGFGRFLTFTDLYCCHGSFLFRSSLTYMQVSHSRQYGSKKPAI
jgi:hypothetical protein